MSRLDPERSRHLADEMDQIEDVIASQNVKKAGLLDTMREALKAAGFEGSEVAVELAKLRGAIKRRRAERTNPEKAAKDAEKAEGIEIYFDDITGPRVRAREEATEHPEATVYAGRSSSASGLPEDRSFVSRWTEVISCETGRAPEAPQEAIQAAPKSPAPVVARQVHKAIGGAPLSKPAILSDDDRKAALVNMPAFLERARAGEAQ